MQFKTSWSDRWVEGNIYCATGFKNSFAMGTKIVFFSRLRFLSLMHVKVSGSLRIETVFHVMLQYRTICIRYFFACCSSNESKKKSFLLSSLFPLIQILREQTMIFLCAPSIFILKRLWFFKCFY